MKDFLLLYTSNDGHTDFAWFNTEDELLMFVETEGVFTVHEAFEIYNAREVQIK